MERQPSNLLAALSRPPGRGNLLAELAYAQDPISALPAQPVREGMVAPEQPSLRAMGMAYLLDQNSPFHRYGMGWLGPATTGPARAANRATGFTTLDHFGHELRVLQNPSPQQLRGFLARTQYKAGRRLVDPATGDVYVWDAGSPALHRNVADQLGIEWGARTVADMLGLD
jgi:hypothetical protein